MVVHVNMVSKGQDVKGQGVGTAYHSLVRALSKWESDAIQLSFNDDTDADINHIHTVHPYCRQKLMKSKLPTCMHVHFLPETLKGSISLPKPLQNAYYRYVLDMYRAADQLIVVNPIFIDALVDYGIAREKITFIPNVVDREAFKPLPEQEIAPGYAQYGLDPKAPIMLGVGQVQTRKGVNDFVAIAERLPEVQFVWAGGFSFGKITDGYQELKKLVENPPKNVHFIGTVERSEMNLLYNLADCLVMTSYNELFPMSILEAVNAGTPLILRDLDLYRKIYFTDYLTADSVDSFVALISDFLNSETLQARAEAVSQKIAADYAEEQTAATWRDFYQQLLVR